MGWWSTLALFPLSLSLSLSLSLYWTLLNVIKLFFDDRTMTVDKDSFKESLKWTCPSFRTMRRLLTKWERNEKSRITYDFHTILVYSHTESVFSDFESNIG